MEYTHIIWDFNGTVLDDLAPCIEVLNIMLERRSLPVCDEKRYKEIFGFPIKSYYKAAGFDFGKEDFSVLADEWAELYREKTAGCGLCDGVKEALDFFADRQIPQIILSATERTMLTKQLRSLGISDFFEETLALDNLYAFSKVELGKTWVKRVSPKKALFLGDTLHDCETATAMGVDCALIATGHQSRERLLSAGVPVYGGISELIAQIQ